jgi:hypothetical protein
MQGTIFTVFSDMVIDTLGMAVWDELLARVEPVSGGIYTNGSQYDDQELTRLVSGLSAITGQPAQGLIVAFGQFMFKRLYDNSPADISKITKLRDFLLAIDGVIHKEVKRLNPDSYLPTFEYADADNGDLIMFYHSKRKLCAAAEGLIHGAAAQFDESIELSHPQCMHHGAPKCQLVIQFKE